MNPAPFFLKPRPGDPVPLYTSTENSFSFPSTISFRSLDLSTDLPLIHDWTAQPYTARYWQLNVDLDELQNIYRSILDSPMAHSFIGQLGEKIVCQIDCYQVGAEEIKEHVEDHPGYCGIHILMCPPRELKKGLTEAMLKAFAEFYFSHPEASILYGEPDISNQWGNRAAQRAGFTFQKTIQLSYKTANLYALTREQFFTHALL